MLKKNKFSIFLALIIMYLSLSSSDTFDKVHILNIIFFDKIVHLIMYFTFMLIILFENRKTLKNNRQIFLISLAPFCYGILMEILQQTLTSSRSGSYFDVLFNTIGIIFSILLWLWLKPFNKETIR